MPLIKNVTCRGHNSVPYRHQLHGLCQESLEDSAISTAQRFKDLDALGSFQRIKIILKGVAAGSGLPVERGRRLWGWGCRAEEEA